MICTVYAAQLILSESICQLEIGLSLKLQFMYMDSVPDLKCPC